MKTQRKVILIGAIALVSFASCTKVRTCVCRTSQGEEIKNVILANKKNAEKKCHEYEASYNASCELVK